MDSGERLPRLRRRQFVILAVLLAAVIGLLLTSVVAVAARDDERQGLYSEEADGTAMTFVQRESFGLIIELDRWALGDATAREVQIARALLGQRLQVRTASGLTTYELADDRYRSSLAALDDVVRGLGDIVDAQRASHRRDVDEIVDAFEVGTRELSTVFQVITRERAETALNRRALTEQIQAVLAGVIILLGVVLAGSIATDFRVGYRRSLERLQEETRRLDQARSRLEFRQRLEEAAAAWNNAVAAGVATPEIVRSALADLARLAPELTVRTVVDAHQAITVKREHPGRTSSRDADDSGTLDPADAASAIDFLNQALRLAHTRDQRENALERARHFDALTGLPNRDQLQPAVAAALDRARRAPRQRVVCLALIDIDRFADFNFSYGHAEGDRLLVAVAAAVQERSGDRAQVLRLSADEFAVVSRHATTAEAERHLNGLSQALRFSHRVDGDDVDVSVTIGANVDEAPNRNAEVFVQRSAAALAAAQSEEPRLPVRLFVAEHDEHRMAVMQEESALRAALRSGEFVTHFQPIMELVSDTFSGCEVLVRWQRPGVGLIGPNDFLPAIARAGLTVELGWQIIDSALSLWGIERKRAGGALDHASISINLDAAQLAVPTLADYVLNAAERSGVSAHNVVVEVTEHALLVGEVALAQLHALRASGVRVALDDFGTGYSSLSQASALPLDALKLDRSFLPGSPLDAQQISIIRDILSIATTLGLDVTAEGIETAEVAAQLRELGVRFGQGWWFAKSMSLRDVETWFESRTASVSGA